MAKKQQKIIIAEDDRFISRALTDKLKREGYDVTLAENGNKCMELLSKEKPDLLLLDLIMPEKNGFDVLADIKADESLKDLSVVVLSNLGQDGDIEKAKSLGAKDFFVKANFQMKEIVKIVEKYI